MATASDSKTALPRLTGYCLTSAISSDDGFSSGGSAPASPRSIKPRSPHHPAERSLCVTLPSATGAARDGPLIPSALSVTSSSSGGSVTPPPSSSVAIAPSSASPLPACSLERLLNEKKTMLASFEAKINQQIVARHQEILDDQRRSFESKIAHDRDGSLAREVERLRGELEKQKFSHEVELTVQRKKVEKLEIDLGKEWKAHNDLKSSDRTIKRVKQLEKELKRERDLRIDQLKSLEQLHFAECKQIEKKHAEFISHLVAFHRKEIRGLTGKTEGGCNITKPGESQDGKVSSEQQESSDTAAAAVALSSLAGPLSPPPADNFSSPATADKDIDMFALAVADQLPLTPSQVGDAAPTPLASPKKGGAKTIGTTGAKRKKRKSPCAAPDSPVPKPQNASEVSDGGSTSGDNEELDRSQPTAKKARGFSKQRQRDQVEEILRKAGKMPPAKKPTSKGEKKKTLSDQTKDYLKAWMMSPEHCDHPYPTPEEKAVIIADTGINFTELNNWFVNNRKRFWQNVVKPKIPGIKKAHRMKTMEESYKSCDAKN